MHVRYKVKESPVHGIGLFSDQEVKSGDIIYTPNSLLDVDLTRNEFDALDPSEQKEVAYYGYWNRYSHRWHVAFEAIRFLNHGNSTFANVTQDEHMVMRAKKDIAPGDEMLQDYYEIYSPNDAHFTQIKL